MKKLMICVIAAALLCAFALPAAAADDKPEYSFYGIARMFTSYESANAETANRATLPGATAKGWNAPVNGRQDDKDLAWTLQGTTQVGMRAKWGNIGGHVQFREQVAGDPGDYVTTTALFYGTWNFGAGTLLIGRDFTPYMLGGVSNFCGPGAGDCGGVGYGMAYGYRMDQIKLIMGGFQFALIKPGRGADTDLPLAVDSDTKLPKIEASYSLNLGPAALAISGGYNRSSKEWETAGALRDVDITSWALASTARMAFGPFYLNLGGQYGRNVGNAPWASNLVTTTIAYDAARDNTEDADYLALLGVVGFNLTEAMKIEGGIMWQRGTQDSPLAAGGEWEDTLTVYYLQLGWSPAKNVTISPEFAIIDYGKWQRPGVADDLDFGKLTYLGIKWQINF